MDISGKRGVILGGGRVAAGKIAALLPFSPQLVCIAPIICGEIESMAQACGEGPDGLRLIRRRARAEDLDGAFFVIAATDCQETNAWAARLCREQGILINAVDDRKNCSFYFPALVKRGPVTVGISTGGASPAAASWLRRKIQRMIPEGLQDTVERLGGLRERVTGSALPQKERAALLKQLFAFCERKDFQLTDGELDGLLETLLQKERNEEAVKMGKKLRIGTRGSRLALAQAALVEKALAEAFPGLETELVILRTRGDQVQDRPLSQVGQKGVFVSEFETALLEGRMDLAVHSGKDLPVRLADGLEIAAVLPRADARDVLVLPGRGGLAGTEEKTAPQGGASCTSCVACAPGGLAGEGDALRALAALPAGAVIGTGSLRRQLYGKRFCPQAEFRLIRGNVDSRLKKLEAGGYDGLILAKAGLDRLGIPEREGDRFLFLPLPEDRFLPAACQGIIAVEGRCGDDFSRLAQAVDDASTRLAFETERRALWNFGADCSAPAAALCRVETPGEVELSVMYAGRECSGGAPQEERLALADALCAQIKQIKQEEQKKKEKQPGKVWLVGAGCGGPELITVKGLSLIRRCDVLLYDSLSAKELLDQARPDCERIDVGKRYGGRAASQEEINALLVQKAQEGKCVVRLKGGDPYVFGRGGEEMLAMRRAGIGCEEVPGISSAFAAPAAAGIPVTHRGLSRSVTVLTASSLTEGAERLTETDYQALARLSGTLVILMGMHHLEELTARLTEAGLPPSTPAAIVMEGATSRQKWVRAPLERLPEEASRAGLGAPAVIVIGETAALRLEEMTFSGESFFEKVTFSGEASSDGLPVPDTASPEACGGPLSGLLIGVTGTQGFAERLSEALHRQGAQTVDAGFLETVPAKEPLPELSGFDWLVFTSPNGVRLFLEKMRRERLDLRTLAGKRIAVIGPGTGQTLAQSGLLADLMPEIHDARHLGEALAERMKPEERALLLRSGLGSAELTERLNAAGRDQLDFALYELKEDPKRRADAFARLRQTPPDYLLFGSASGVRAFLDGLAEYAGDAEPTASSPPPRVGCIGPQCRAAWEEGKKRMGKALQDWPEAFTAERFDIEGLVRAVAGDREKRRDGCRDFGD